MESRNSGYGALSLATSSEAGSDIDVPDTSVRNVVVPFPAPERTLGIATSVRSTLVVSSLLSLHRRGLTEAYYAKLPPEHHDEVKSMIGGDWIPMNLARVHYEACEALELGDREAIAIGREVGERMEGTFLAGMVRMAKRVGVTPWTALAFTERLYTRVVAGGGGTSVVRGGPKDALVTMTGLELLRIPYFRAGMGGVFETAVELFCTKAYVRVVPDPGGAPRIVAHVTWA